MQGLVTRVFKKHGKKTYGFIDGVDGESYYFNGRSLLTEVHENDEVFFKASFNEKGSFARDVQLMVKPDGGNNGRI